MSMWRNAAGHPVSARTTREVAKFEPTRKRPGDVVISTWPAFRRPLRATCFRHCHSNQAGEKYNHGKLESNTRLGGAL